MDEDGPWTCGACGAGNAAYRRRCIDCGERRPPAAAPAAGGPVDIPLPVLVRRRQRRGISWLSVLGVAAVLALAAFGAASYLGADRPTPEDDLEALRIALDGGSVLGPAYLQVVYTEAIDGVRAPILTGAGLTGCRPEVAADLGRREDVLLYDRGENETPHLHAAYQAPDGAIVDVRLFAFRTAGLARSYEALLLEDAPTCGVDLELGEQLLRAGRAVVVVAAAGSEPQPGLATPPVLDRLAERLEIEG